jgi:hypothetical protein
MSYKQEIQKFELKMRIVKKDLWNREQNDDEIIKNQFLFYENGILFHNLDELKHFTNEDDFFDSDFSVL